MVTDWIATLKEQSQIVQRLAREVPRAIAHPDLTLDQASRIYGLVEKRAENFDRIMEDMKGEELDDALHAAASRLEDMWTVLCLGAGNKMRVMQGLEPIELPNERDE